MIVLIGFMGAGKSTVGRLLAERIGLKFVDTDDLVERADGRSVKTIFEADGEGRFRALERDAVARALESPDSVVALGGGAINDPVTCASLEWHTVVHLDVGYPDAMQRVGRDPGRPLLHAADPRALYDDRRDIYTRLATHVVDTGSRSAEEVVTAVIEATGAHGDDFLPPLRVDLGDRSYSLLVGADLSSDVAARVDLPGCERAFVLTHPSLVDAAKPVADSFGSRGIDTEVLIVDDGEASKSLAVAGRLLEQIAGRGAHRNDVVIGFGGGVVCDLAGFVASTYHRGMRVVHVPTTLLAQVDAAIGGKTAVNLSHGKNLVGTFHQPEAVICDVSLLRSLPDEELRSGLAEVVKYGLIADPDLLATLPARAAGLLARGEEELISTVRRSAAIKASIVSADERDRGHREILNYGHTFGHAIEHVTGMRHGEAISIGMMAAAHLSIALGLLDDAALEAHRSCLLAMGLPVAASFDGRAVLHALKHDKKHMGSVRFVLLEAIGAVRTGVEADDHEIAVALRKVTL